MRLLLVPALLSLLGGCEVISGGPACDPTSAPGCSDTNQPDPCAECSGSYYTCDETTGMWKQITCESPPVVLEGTIELRQGVDTTTAGCPAAVTSRDPLVLTIVDGTPKTITADAPIVITDSTVVDSTDSEAARVTVELTDDWGGGFAPTVTYTLDAYYDGTIAGRATASSGDCTVELSAWGGWHARW